MSAHSVRWPKYNPQAIEPALQQHWEESGLYLASEGGNKPKFTCLEFFPYPSGEGLHVGHCRNYVPTDVISRYKRMNGFNVLHPMGWDAFGEPAEQFAVSRGVHPRITTDRNATNFRRQFRLIGAGYDWSREIDSSDPRYYRWTQWFFLMLYKRGLAYRDTHWQWWCPVCQTTLSSHEVSGDTCWRGHKGVTRREIPAWYFRITAYSDRLLEGLDRIDWPDNIKAMQRNWIGRSEGVEIAFPVEGLEGERIPVFTTRPDTLFGVTFIALAPEHPLAVRIAAPEQQAAVQAYIAEAVRRSELDRMADTRQKTGVFTGQYAIHPLSGERVPVWIADFVLPGYGKGAVMGVPAHDTRDFDFARLFGIPVHPVIVPEGNTDMPLEQAYTSEGRLVDSGEFNGLTSAEGAQRIAEYLEAQGIGQRVVQYRMRDWLISRQRYWGAPIPIIHCTSCGEQPVPEDQLPVLLPQMDDFQPDGSGRSPLARVPEFVNTTCPRCGGPARRETDTMGGFACSSWYFLRFTSPHYDQGPFEPEAMRYWMPVDLYVGGAEHAVLHLLYARFWTKVMCDAGLVPFDEPFPRLMNQGQLHGLDGFRMSKSRGNVITPDEIAMTYGVDSLRIYSMFVAPFEQDVYWTNEGVSGARRFLNRVWDLYGATYSGSADAQEIDPELERALHGVIRDVSERIEGFRFNTMISALMEFTNTLSERQRLDQWRTATFHNSLDTLVILLAPAAPHIAEELWRLTGHENSVHQQAWPAWNADLARQETVQVAVQVDGRLRDVIDIPPDLPEAEVRALVFERSAIKTHLTGQEVRRVIYVPGKVVNIVRERNTNTR